MQYVFGMGVAGLAVLAVAVGLTADSEREALARQGAELDGRCQAAVRRCADKHLTAVALLRGETSIEAAADRFAQILGTEPEVAARVREKRPGVSDRELAYRQLAECVRAAGARDPGGAEAVAAAVDAEADRLSALPAAPTARVVSVE